MVTPTVLEGGGGVPDTELSRAGATAGASTGAAASAEGAGPGALSGGDEGRVGMPGITGVGGGETPGVGRSISETPQENSSPAVMRMAVRCFMTCPIVDLWRSGLRLSVFLQSWPRG
jgi:hypothetical protein